MEKMIAVVAVICTQPEQSPFSLEDMWILLSRMTNYTSRLPKAPFYLPSIYNILLRIVSPKLVEKYGDQYIALVKVIDTEIFARLEDGIARGKLRIFLDQFLNSNGATCEKFFSNNDQ